MHKRRQSGRLHTIEFQVYDIQEKAKLETVER